MKKKIYSVIRTIALLAACIAFTVASYSLTKTYLNYQNADAAYTEIDDMFLQTEAVVENQTLSEGETLAEGETNSDGSAVGGQTVEMGYTANVEKWVWDYEAMLEYNPESVGYIKLDDSRIQYPIVQHSDNDYYLERGSNRISNGSGAIFVDARQQGGLDARSCIVYGHDMLDGSMFAGLLDYGKPEFCKTHQVFDIYIGYKHYRYYVFATFRADALDEKVYKFGFEDDAEYSEWLSRCMSKSNFKYDIGKPSVDDKTIMLSTCIDDETLRFVVVLVRGEEVVD